MRLRQTAADDARERARIRLANLIKVKMSMCTIWFYSSDRNNILVEVISLPWVLAPSPVRFHIKRWLFSDFEGVVVKRAGRFTLISIR